MKSFAISLHNFINCFKQLNFYLNIYRTDKVVQSQFIRMSELVKKWYVVRAISGNEKKVKQYLERKLPTRICRITFHRC